MEGIRTEGKGRKRLEKKRMWRKQTEVSRKCQNGGGMGKKGERID